MPPLLTFIVKLRRAARILVLGVGTARDIRDVELAVEASATLETGVVRLAAGDVAEVVISARDHGWVRLVLATQVACPIGHEDVRPVRHRHLLLMLGIVMIFRDWVARYLDMNLSGKTGLVADG